MSTTKIFDTQLLKKSVAIADYLATKGINPSKTLGNQLVYLSPITEERTQSFFVDPRQNVFTCFASNEKGDIIKLVRVLENKSFQDACKVLENFQGIDIKPITITPEAIQKTTVRRVCELNTPALIRYVESRHIPIALARKYLSEVHYTVKSELKENHFYALGFRNNSNGYELRTAKFKGCTGCKDIRFIEGKESLSNGCTVLILFEGFFDFLSFLTHKRLIHTPYDTIILNSTGQLNRALPIIENYSSIVAYLDNDLAGERALVTLIELTRIPVLNASKKYLPNSKDYNDYLCQSKA
ncbi:toprim domain-containing protein [Runella sp.]|uniref:toprim domain-containing protein n=1 Tax=Runella sp. TaxID=1960881 RepID=UPI003D1378A6